MAIAFAIVYEQQSHYISQTIVRHWSDKYDYRRRLTVTNTGWLDGWNKRIKITVDHNDIDSTLFDFPVLIHLSNSSGRSNYDVSFVFDELQNNANRKKIAITTSNQTQCYVEIEKWDSANEQAWLWVKVPSIDSTSDTVLYLYYDRDHADNIDYVGDTDSTPAENVWDSSFKGVWHLCETIGGINATKDSTSNNNDGTDYGSPALGTTGQIDNAIDFDGIDDYVSISNSQSLQFDSSLTLEAWINLNSFGSGFDVDVILRKGEGNPNDYQLALHDQLLALMIEESDGQGLNSSTGLSANTWFYVAGTWNGSTRKVYINGSEDGSGPKTGSIIPDTRAVYIGGRSGTDLSDGIIDEVRASNMTRNAAWVKAGYESGRDDLVDYGSEESATLSDYSVSLIMDTASLVSVGKMFSSGDDLRIVYWSGTSWIELDRDVIDMNTTSSSVWFKIQADIPGGNSDNNYFLYYGNTTAGSPPANRSNVYIWFDDFSTNTTNNYDIDRHANDWHGSATNVYKPYWDSANNAVYFDTGDNYAGGWMPTAVNEVNVYAEMKMQITGSYLSNTTNGVLLRWQDKDTFYGGHISGGSYESPCLVKNGRTTYIAYQSPSEYHLWNQWFTLAVAVSGTDLKLWVDGNLKVTGTDTQISTSGKISYVAGQAIGWMDDFMIRKYVEPEPSTSLGPEESL